MDQSADTSLEQQKNRLVDQGLQNASVAAAIQTFNVLTTLGIAQPPRLVSTGQVRFDASGNY
ncbi:hypothetical protein [Mycolicibacterium fortuitum]|uniref:hypothetical protein n=1 Tax=Mycolicibacterium fortuitum TaxID=1766 RepID=UPI00096C1157|nr:hypothetical protein [Mycolicibacterium fortuitum]OMC11929.1 hypothetical protein A5734_22765 [Mycolicibacterium fortuitum]